MTRLLASGDAFADMATLGNFPCPASVEATESMKALFLSSPRIDQWLLDHPLACRQVLTNTATEAGETAEGLAGVARDQVRSAGQRINVSIVIRAVGAFHENSEIAAQRNGGAAIDAIGLRVVAVVGIYVRDVGADRSARLSEGSAGDHGETRQEGGGHDIIFHVLVLSIGAGGLLAALIYQPPDRFTVTAESHRCQPLSLSVGSDFACRAQTKRAAPKDRPYRRSSVSAASGGCLHRIS